MEANQKRSIGVYLRVSSRERALYGYGLTAQKEKNLAYISLYGYEDAKIEFYIDDGVSAKDLKRPAMQRLLNDVKERKIDMIVIYKLDRLARSVIDIYKLISLLIEYGCQLVAVLDRLDINTANGRMLVGMLAIIAQWEREVVLERTIDGIDAMVGEGKYPYGGYPFGWTKDENKYLKVDFRASEIINFLGDMANQGYFISEITEVLKEKYGISKKAETVKKWLTRDINAGLFNYKGICYTNIVPAIMTKEKLFSIRKSLEKRQPTIDKMKYYFSNLVYCSCGNKCDHKVTNKKSKKYYYYECPKCYKRINQTWVLEQVLDEIFIHSDKMQFTEVEDKCIKKIEEINRKINKLYKNYLGNSIDTKSYVFSISNLERERAVQKSKIESLFVDSKSLFFYKNDGTRKNFIQRYVARVIVDLDIKLVISLNFKTIQK